MLISGKMICSLSEVLLVNQLLDNTQVDGLVFHTVDILETELRYTALEWHLTTLETDLLLITRSCLGTLVSASGSTTLA